MSKKSYEKQQKDMKKNTNNSSNKGEGTLAKIAAIGLIVIACIDIITSRGYRVKGGGSLGSGKDKKSCWFDCRPGEKGGNKGTSGKKRPRM